MDFFESLGRKITDFAENTGDRVKDFADSNKLKLAINDEEEKIEQSYIEVGKRVFKAEGNNSDSLYKDEFANIRAALNKISEFNAQINANKKRVEEDAAARKKATEEAEKQYQEAKPVTAEPFDTQSNTDALACSDCGKVLEQNACFCTTCGKKL
ncbi:MAG: hypothetical protein FWF37_02575 [Chloroflexi bacterium]|nr:hypothetical protein [Chloroflexota bacterium]